MYSMHILYMFYVFHRPHPMETIPSLLSLWPSFALPFLVLLYSFSHFLVNSVHYYRRQAHLRTGTLKYNFVAFLILLKDSVLIVHLLEGEKKITKILLLLFFVLINYFKGGRRKYHPKKANPNVSLGWMGVFAVRLKLNAQLQGIAPIFQFFS